MIKYDCMYPVLGGVANPQTIWANPPDQIHYDIADWALAGNRLFPIGYSLWYLNPYVPECAYSFPYNGRNYEFRNIEHLKAFK